MGIKIVFFQTVITCLIIGVIPSKTVLSATFVNNLEAQIKISNNIGNNISNNNVECQGWDFAYRGEYQQAIKCFEKKLETTREKADVFGEAYVLYGLGWVYRSLGEYPQAINYFQQALTIFKDIKNPTGEAYALGGIGWTYYYLKQYKQAIEFHQQTLAIRKEIGDALGEAFSLGGLGVAYSQMGVPQQAIEFHQKQLLIVQKLGKRREEAYAFGDLGLAYSGLEKYQQAMEFYQQSLAIQQEIEDRWGEGITLSYMGDVMAKQNQSELAIIFYKQSVNVREAIRKYLRELPREQQQSYTKTVADTYRSLADLLLQKNRVLEAQQILDLLKVQEVDDYLQNVRGNLATAEGIELLSPEEIFWKKYNEIQNQAILMGKDLTRLRQIPESEITVKQKQEIEEIEQNLAMILARLKEFIYRQEVAELMENLNQMAKSQKLNLAALSHLQKLLLQSKNHQAVLLYPLVLEDRLELVLVTADSAPIHHTVAVKREDLNREISQLIAGFTNRSRAELLGKQANQKVIDEKVTKPALQLYEWLVKPLENSLKNVGAKTIIYAPDGQLRYIPLAGLYDGEKWLVERFQINNITAASLINFDRKSDVKIRVLAGGLSEGNYDFQVGNQKFTFDALPFAAPEINSLASLFPETTKLLGNTFTRQAIVPQMNQYNIVHLATHAAFVRGKPEDSFILFGDGDRVTLRDVESWDLKNVDLVVLSACQTGVGGILGNGAEILGFGYMMQQAGALATLASLWRVDDEATQKLMQEFYTQLQSANMTKAEALRQAQISLINSNYKGGHPYYWAPFILIGNGF